MATEQQSAWVRRVLGVDVGSARWSALLPVWRDAKDEVDTSIARLQTALRATGDDDLEQIAEAGLYGATTGESVRLQAALREGDADGGTPATRRAILGAVDDYRAFLDGAPIVGLLEANAWHPIPLRRVLGPALDRMERQAAV